jgi:putative transposase
VKPTREHATNYGQTYFVTASSWQRRALFANSRWADLFLKTLHSYRGPEYLLHAYVLMPDHFHILLTPGGTLERAVQLVKGGFSFRAKKELGSSAEIWQRGFSDHRVRDHEDFEIHVSYIHRNPVGKKLAERASDYPYCSAFPGSEKDEVPHRLKPLEGVARDTAKAVSFQNEADDTAEAVSFQNRANDTAEAVPFQNTADDAAEAVPFQNRADDTAEAVSLQNKANDAAEAVPFQNEAALKGHAFRRAINDEYKTGL